MPAIVHRSVDDLLAQLEQGIENLGSSDMWRRWLATQARFHTYSWSNSLLIALQRPEATQVAGYQTWRSLNRHVRPGERGIRILAPLVRRTHPDDATGDTEAVVVGYRSAHVFDIAQTDGDALPQHPCQLLSGCAPQEVEVRLWADLVERGFLVITTDLPDGCNGATSFLPPIVRLRRGMSEAQRLKTLAHEFAHVLLHDPRHGTEDQERAVQELEAESVAYIVMSTFNVDSSDYSFGYCATWAGGAPEATAVLRTMAGRVSRTAQAIIAVAAEERSRAQTSGSARGAGYSPASMRSSARRAIAS